MQVLFRLFPAALLCTPSSSKEHDSTATQSQVTDALSIHPTPCPRPPKKVPEWLVSSFTCAPMSLPCPSSYPGESGVGRLAGPDWGGGSEFCERKCTFLYLGQDCCFTLFVTQTNTVIVIWQFTLPLRHVIIWLGKEWGQIYDLTQTWFKRTLKKEHHLLL